MNYLLTGTLGHAAPHLAEILMEKGHKVYGLIRTSSGRPYDSMLHVLTTKEVDNITFCYGDLTDYQSLFKIFTEHKFDGVFHLGAQSSPPIAFKDPIGTMRVNVGGTMKLVEAIISTGQNKNCVLCNVSTSEVYGDTCKDVGILKEDMKLLPNNPYGWSKMCAETYVTERCNNNLLKGFNTRAFSHLAPGRGKNFSISWDAYHLAGALGRTAWDVSSRTTEAYALPYNLPVGNLKTKRIVIDARDCMLAYVMLMEEFQKRNGYGMNGESFNVCGDADSVKEMEFFTDTLINLSGLTNVTKKIDMRVYRPIDIKIQIGDTTKLKSYTQWEPTIPIVDTLREVLNYWIKKLK